MRSLVEVCAEQREPKWRELDAVMERLGEAVGVGPLVRVGRPASLTIEEEAEVVQLTESGWKPAAIAERLGARRDTVRSVIRRARRNGRGRSTMEGK